VILACSTGAQVAIKKLHRIDLKAFYEFKLKGTPWFSASDSTIEARKLLLQIIVQMAFWGYKYHAAINIKVRAVCNKTTF
jgi:hypothetical protein